jgi:hypothetical protein
MSSVARTLFEKIWDSLAETLRLDSQIGAYESTHRDYNSGIPADVAQLVRIA